jgi:hypothetical protein
MGLQRQRIDNVSTVLYRSISWERCHAAAGSQGRHHSDSRACRNQGDAQSFFLDGKAHAAFLALLDAPVKPNAALKALMARKPAWQR